MKKYFYLMMAVVGMMTLTACGSDDDDNSGSTNPPATPSVVVNQQNLQGTWLMTHIKGTSEGVAFDMDVNSSAACLAELERLDVCDYYRYTFSGNLFFCDIYNKTAGQFVRYADATYTVTDNVITCVYVRHTEKVTVLELTADQLVMYDNDAEEGYSITVTMKRIN